MENFQEWIEGILYEIDEAVGEIETKAKQKVELIAEENNVKDYSDIIKLSYTTSLETKDCSTELLKIVFVFTWRDAREV